MLRAAPECFARARYTEGVVKILLLGTYELGRQPFGLASAAAWLRRAGHSARCFDLSRQTLDEAALREAELIVFYLPMHTATRLALQWLPVIRQKNPVARFCACGLYAPLNQSLLQTAGVSLVLGPEFESDLVKIAEGVSFSELPAIGATNGKPGIPRLEFQVPDRSDLPALRKYAHVVLPDGAELTGGYTEASRGCKHTCRHCPIVPVYAGQFRVVPADVVMADIRQQVESGAQHITFGDPDFFNGVTHGTRIVQALHEEFPRLSYDVTIKIEHLLRHSDQLPVLARTGCLFLTSAVESLDNEILRKLDKGHTREEFFRALDLCADAGLTLQPTFVPFTPWTTRAGYFSLLRTIAERELVAAVPTIQMAIRLLIPSRSRLLELPEIVTGIGDFDEQLLVYPWAHSDPAMDELAKKVLDIAAAGEKRRSSRAEAFEEIWRVAAEMQSPHPAPSPELQSTRPVPFLSEPWYC